MDLTGAKVYSNRYKTRMSFKTQSDALLAGLFLDNNFPFDLFSKLFDVLRDPSFNLAELSFDNAAEFFTGVSQSRVVASQKRLAQSEVTNCSKQKVADHAIRPYAVPGGVPPLVLDLVVDRMLADATPFGVLVARQYYDALEQNLWAFSRVHRTWTAPAQRALRPCARVSLDYVGRFLLSPLCGPWITELAVYTPVETDTGVVTDEHVWLLECLLARTPNVRAFSFQTLPPLRGPKGNHYVNIARCIQLVPRFLPLVEKLWLDHDIANNKAEPCPLLEDLRRTLVHMHQLKFLYMKGWADGLIEENFVSPPPSLEEVELASPQDMMQSKAFYSWLLQPRKEFMLQSLSFALSRSCRNLSKELGGLLESCLPTIRKLRLCYGKDEFGVSPHEPIYSSILQHCTALTELDLFASSFKQNPPSKLELPLTLRKLSIHYNAPWRQLFVDAPAGVHEILDADMCAVVSMLPALHDLVVSGSRPACSFPVSFGMDALVNHMQGEKVEEKDMPQQTRELCMQRGIRFLCLQDAFPRQWEYTIIPDYSYMYM